MNLSTFYYLQKFYALLTVMKILQLSFCHKLSEFLSKKRTLVPHVCHNVSILFTKWYKEGVWLYFVYFPETHASFF